MVLTHRWIKTHFGRTTSDWFEKRFPAGWAEAMDVFRAIWRERKWSLDYKSIVGFWLVDDISLRRPSRKALALRVQWYARRTNCKPRLYTSRRGRFLALRRLDEKALLAILALENKEH